MRSLRMDVISSGRSFKWFSLSVGHEFAAKPFEAAAHARVDAHRAGLQDETADEIRIDAAGRFDLAAGGLLDLLDDLLRFLLRELERRRQLDVEAALFARHQ